MSENIMIYMQILVNSLEKKKEILGKIVEGTRKQEQILNVPSFDLDAFNATIDDKADLIEELNQLDDGFENVYQRVKGEFESNRNQYKDDIIKIQGLITELTEMSVKLQTMEQRNSTKLQITLVGQRQKVKTAKVNSQTAMSYYKNMANQHQGQSYFLDKKK